MTETPAPETPAAQPKPQSHTRLSLVIAGILILAVLLVWALSGSGDKPAFPQLAQNPDSVQRIVITGAGDEMTLRAEGKSWVVDSLGGIRVTDAAARTFIRGLRNTHIAQVVAATPDLVARSKLAQPPLRISLYGADGGPALTAYALAEADAGEEVRYALSADGKHILRLRGMPALSLALDRWIAPEAPAMPADEIKSIRRIGPDGETMLWQRASADESFAADPSAGAAPTAAFTALKADEFKAAKAINWYGSTALLFTTFDDVTYTVQVKREQDGATWVRYNGDAAPDGDRAAKDRAAEAKQLKAIAFRVPATPKAQAAR